jgi:hypothetical protein
MNVERPDSGRATDPGLDRAWHSASSEEPPPHVDAAILAAARSPRPRLHAWQPLAAVATVAALAFLLVQLLPRERTVEAPITVETAPARPPSPGAREQAKASAEAVARSAVPAAPPVVATERTQAPRQVAPRVDAAAPPDTQEARDATAGNALRTAPEAVQAMSPGQWSALIETIFRSGDMDAAESQLREFRAAYADADHYLPLELRDWASGIK